ncbi:MAG: inositol monophosphatase [Acidimicrobiia bacterium]|nr:inositol monophosphatase [Acidimicrobiia bacterium]MDH4363467.1 inositol monophosphatase [Acidimicrobiia bacterium]MDH5288889.1 inositol monophosphatase [Acidimicrobiia bacterium]
MIEPTVPSPAPQPGAGLAELGALAAGLARAAGHLALAEAAAVRQGRGSGSRGDAETKSSPTDLVTAADRAAETLIIDGILTARPADGIAGEEGGSRAGTSGVVWHIDPIDGTTNYVYGIPAFAVSIGVEADGDLVAGAVFHPSRGCLYHALRGGGAWRDAEPLRCSPLADLATALVATGFAYRPERRRHQASVLIKVLPRIRDIRRFGSAALDLCAVASGEVDAYWEQGLNHWDLAGGTVVAREAGALVGNLRDGPPDAGCLLAAPPALFPPLRNLLLGARADADG